jgi:SNF2 family DNA or RNA helicase
MSDDEERKVTSEEEEEDDEGDEEKPKSKRFVKANPESEKVRTAMNAEISADMDDKIAKRLEFIQKQTDLLMHFEPSKGAYSGKGGEAKGRGTRGRMSEKAEDDLLLKRAETETSGDNVNADDQRLTKQPSILVNGTLREYQLEGLNWLVSP